MNPFLLKTLLIVFGLYFLGFLFVLYDGVAGFYKFKNYKGLIHYISFIIFFPIFTGLIICLVLIMTLFFFGMHPTNWL